jgi:hypothetical protein
MPARKKPGAPAAASPKSAPSLEPCPQPDSPVIRELEARQAALNKALRDNPELAHVTLTVDNFENVLTTTSEGRDTKYKMHVHGTKDVYQDGPDLIIAKTRVVYLHIRIDASEGSYFPLGLALEPQRPAAPPPSFFSYQQDIFREDLYLTLDFGTDYPDEPGRLYKFFVAIQRQSDYAIAIIDPGIEHER